MNPDRVIAEARLWIGTPYRHQQSTLGAGCDCLGLIRGVWRGLYGAEPEPVPPYAPDWAAAGRDRMREAAERWLKAAEAGPGAVILFKARQTARLATHCGLLTENGMIHATNDPSLGAPGVIEMGLRPGMAALMLPHAWAFP